ncbi:hypothetical protein [Sulfurospirillum cavolei]|uniref:hypothetical protein n=1 Tax=Sulfurospirillum cavolei TaxID=366522 RepID=UPI0005A8F62F|nr:hypothetical protein [Sulfurospirillum cavolei]
MTYKEVPKSIELFDVKVARMVHVIEDAVKNGQIHNMAKALVEKEEELKKLRAEHAIKSMKASFLHVKVLRLLRNKYDLLIELGELQQKYNELTSGKK